MSGRLKGKTAVVTGASKGIGASIALHLAAEGAAVAVNYASGKEGAERVVAEITRNGGKAIAVQANVARQSDIQRLFAEAKKAFGTYFPHQRRGSSLSFPFHHLGSVLSFVRLSRDAQQTQDLGLNG